MSGQGPFRLAELRARDGATVAVVGGEALRELPRDLYIPPDALEVFLETFEGPLDLLLYLIRRQNLDVLEVPVAEITRQYMSYVELMKALHLELAGEYLAMAAMLAEIKSRLLLPRSEDSAEEEDPRAELVRRLKEYEQLKNAAQQLAELPRLERDIFAARPERPEPVKRQAEPSVGMKELLIALAEALHRADLFRSHAMQLEPLSVRERMSDVLARVSEARQFVPFADLLRGKEGRRGVVVTFLAIMELIREGLIDCAQNAPFGPIYVRAAGDRP